MFKLRIEWCGSPEHQRFVLTDGEGCYWSGTGWTKDFGGCRLYLTHQDCARVFTQIAEQHFADKPLRQFEMRVQVRVFARQGYSVQDLKQYLSDAATLVLRPERGYGPVEDSLVTIEIPWENLSEVTPRTEH